jgi:S1-C subfamily serine protease
MNAADQAILDKFRPAVVMIVVSSPKRGQKSCGTGFFTSPDGELVTNFHVMQPFVDDPLASAEFTLGDGKIIRNFKVGKCGDMKHDLCLLRLAVYPDKYFSTRRDLPGRGTQIYSIGNPSCSQFNVASGRFIETQFIDAVSEVAINLNMRPGMSGGPIFGPGGDLVGVATRTHKSWIPVVPKDVRPDNLSNLGISVKEVHKFQEKIERFVSPHEYFKGPGRPPG